MDLEETINNAASKIFDAIKEHNGEYCYFDLQERIFSNLPWYVVYRAVQSLFDENKIREIIQDDCKFHFFVEVI